jgi:DNA-binding CsgD family transcriptional regulator
MPALTTRETEVLQWALTGKPDAEVAAILGLSAKTVNFHIQNAKTKLGTRSRIEAVVTALRDGLITFPELMRPSSAPAQATPVPNRAPSRWPVPTFAIAPAAMASPSH